MSAVSLKSIAEILVGYQSRKRVMSAPSGTHRLIQGRDFVSAEHLSTEDLLSFTPERNPAPGETVKFEDILFQARGAVHYAHCVTQDLANTLVSGSFYIIRPDRARVCPRYLAWWLNQDPAQQRLKAQSQSTTIPFVSKSVFSRLDVRLPSLERQERIARIIDLRHREMELRRQIMERRQQLIARVCLAGIQEQGA